MGYFYTNDELAHHGILGQKWGIRRFENKNGRLTAAGLKRYEDGRKVTEKEKKQFADDQNDQENQNDKKSGLTPAQKKALIAGIGITAGIIGAYGGYRLYQNYKYKDAEHDPITGLLKKTKEFSPDEDMAAVNRGRRENPFKNFNGDYGNNCMLCTTSYELRRRGLDVKAGEEQNGKNWTDLTKVFDISERRLMDRTKTFPENATKRQKVDKFLEEAKKMGPNARGNLCIHSPIYGGHSIVWENDSNGNTIIRDCQINKVYKKPNEIMDVFRYQEPALMLRTDDLPLNPETFSKRKGAWSRNTNSLDFGKTELEGLLQTTAIGGATGVAAYNVVYNQEENKENNNVTRTSKK